MLVNSYDKPRTPQRVVVIGSRGFLGRELVSYLKSKDFAVLGLSSSDVDLLKPNCVQVLNQTIREGDSVVFFSALTPEKGKDVATFIKNITMAENLAKFVETSKISYFAHISSDAVYTFTETLVNEKTLSLPTELYSYMHIGRELVLKTALEKAKIPFSILRPCAVYGAQDTHNSYGPNRFLRAALQDKKITLFGQGEERRDHIYVGDVVELIALSLQYRSQGALNLASGISTSFMDVAQEVVKVVGEDVKIECLQRSSAITHRDFDIAATKKVFPFMIFTSLNQGLKKMMENMTL